ILFLVRWVKEVDLLSRMREPTQSEMWIELQNGLLTIGDRLSAELTIFMMRFGYICVSLSILLLMISYLPVTKKLDSILKEKWTRRKQLGYRISFIVIIVIFVIWQMNYVINRIIL